MTYDEKRKQAVKLRKEGYSYSLINEKVNVSKSTLTAWLASVPYTPNKETIKKIGRAQAASGATKAKMRKRSIEDARALAKNDVGQLTKRDLFMLGLGVYIGEGTKKVETIRVINSDPKIIKLTMLWLEEALDLKKENFSVRLHLYPDNNKEKSIDFWTELLGLPKSQFSKVQIDSRKGKKEGKRTKLLHGTAHLSVRSTPNSKVGLFPVRRLFGWMEAALGYVKLG